MAFKYYMKLFQLNRITRIWFQQQQKIPANSIQMCHVLYLTTCFMLYNTQVSKDLHKIAI